MKGGILLSKQADFLSSLAASLERINAKYSADDSSLRVSSASEPYILVYGKGKAEELVSEEDLPASVVEQGYRYYFVADCRSEEFFVEIFGNPALELDIIIWDNEGVVFKPEELDATKLSL